MSLITSMSSDYLSSLPPELLVKIFKEFETGLIAGLSRSLLPFTRLTLYHEVIIESPTSFKLFCRTLLEDKLNNLGSQIMKLDIAFSSPRVEKQELNVTEAVKMVKLLVNLRSLHVKWSKLAAIITTRAVASTSLPQLHTLALRSPFAHRSDQWNPLYFQHLKLYSNLQTFNLSNTDIVNRLVRKVRGPESFDAKLEQEMKMLNQDIDSSTVQLLDEKEFKFPDTVRHFTFMVALEDEDSVEIIISHHNLEKLTLLNEFTNDMVFQVFNKLSNAPQLKELVFKHSNQTSVPFNRQIFPRLYPSISNFTGLTRLELPQHQFTSDIFIYLRDPLPLVYLSFAKDTPVSIEDLKLLILPGIAKLSSLKTLVLNVVEGKISPYRVKDLGPCYDNDEPTAHPGWILPKWIEEKFTEKELKVLCKIGKDNGVKIQGSSVKAIGVSELYSEDFSLAQEYEFDEMSSCFECGDEDED